VWKIQDMNEETTLLILPIKEGKPDERFTQSALRILDEIGQETTKTLRQFANETSYLQRQAADSGLKLAVAIFNEAKYLDTHHRFDKDNQHGWRSKSLRKQAQVILENIGFKTKNANKLLSCASWLTDRYFDKSESTWIQSLTPSHIYELSRMSSKGIEAVKKEVSYPEFSFCAGQKEISVRRLEQIRRLFPKESDSTRSPDTSYTDINNGGLPEDKTRVLDAVPNIPDIDSEMPALQTTSGGVDLLIHSLQVISRKDGTDLELSQKQLQALRMHSEILNGLVEAIKGRPVQMLTLE
jgi:hypothetical protein